MRFGGSFAFGKVSFPGVNKVKYSLRNTDIRTFEKKARNYNLNRHSERPKRKIQLPDIDRKVLLHLPIVLFGERGAFCEVCRFAEQVKNLV